MDVEQYIRDSKRDATFHACYAGSTTTIPQTETVLNANHCTWNSTYITVHKRDTVQRKMETSYFAGSDGKTQS